MTATTFSRLMQLLPSDPLQVGTISAVHGDGTATVDLAGGGGTLRVRNPLAKGLSAAVFVQGGAVTGDAPSLPVIQLEI